MSRYVLGESAARRLRELFNRSGAGVGDRAVAGVLQDLDFPAPWTLSWSASANNGAGDWIVWIPTGVVLSVAGQAVDVTGNLEPVGGDYPDGYWRGTGLPQDGGSLYLNVRIPRPDENGETSSVLEAVWGVSPEASGYDYDSIPVLIARATRDQTTGAVSVRQNVTSAIVLLSGGVGGGKRSVGLFEVESVSPYSIELYNRYYRVGGRTYECGASSVALEYDECIVVLDIDASSSEPAASLVAYDSLGSLQEAELNTDHYLIPLYTVSYGAVSCDWRLGATAAMGEF